MFDVNVFAEAVHENAVVHGWHERDISDAEYVAMICSEWAEALDAWRNERAVYSVVDGVPDGVVVELADGVLRIMDYMVERGCDLFDTLDEYKAQNCPTPYGEKLEEVPAESFPQSIGRLMRYTASGVADYGYLDAAIAVALERILLFGVDPEDVLRCKHEYNKARPYRHGGKRC